MYEYEIVLSAPYSGQSKVVYIEALYNSLFEYPITYIHASVMDAVSTAFSIGQRIHQIKQFLLLFQVLRKYFVIWIET